MKNKNKVTSAVDREFLDIINTIQTKIDNIKMYNLKPTIIGVDLETYHTILANSSICSRYDQDSNQSTDMLFGIPLSIYKNTNKRIINVAGVPQ